MDDTEINFPTFKERPEKVDIDMDILNDTIEYIRPAVQADGGDIKLSSVEDGVVVRISSDQIKEASIIDIETN